MLGLCFKNFARDSGFQHFYEDIETPATLADDIVERHFTVFAVQGTEKQRFGVKLHSLRNPAFLSLLEQARVEYGFEQKGVLNLPCRPRQLRWILEGNDQRNAANDMWSACDSILIQGYLLGKGTEIHSFFCRPFSEKFCFLGFFI